MILILVALVGLPGFLWYDHVQTEKFKQSCVNQPYQAIVMTMGTPSEREDFEDGTSVLCWKQYHGAYTSTILVGKVIVPQYHPPYISGWKAIMKNDKCISMNQL